ncbi:MAG TPA: magnesium chelatase domain-containing protein, partial [Solirubrobacteraceae bacterium]|nr:magnesium chelatase domain-containing protein [Solirubrobacteraceae bacterium]
MLARAHSFAIEGLEARRVCVELDIRSGLPAFNIVGLPGTAVREARERVRAAVLNSEFAFPRQRVTANLAPAHLEKTG